MIDETEYNKLLETAYEKLPETQDVRSRFEIPKVVGHIQGNRTIISNFHQIASTLNRPVEHIFKYILKELAAPGDLKKNGIIIGTKIPAGRINEKIEKYAEEYVVCNECGKPDTKLIKEGSYLFKRCLACGAKHCVKARA
ncbi:MAG: translation initiation factor IF-2 subunit beta [Candidatus Woesearchaeota archaeon]